MSFQSIQEFNLLLELGAARDINVLIPFMISHRLLCVCVCVYKKVEGYADRMTEERQKADQIERDIFM